MNEILVYYKAVGFCLEPLSSAGRKSQIEPSGIIKLSSQSSGFVRLMRKLEFVVSKGNCGKESHVGKKGHKSVQGHITVWPNTNLCTDRVRFLLSQRRTTTGGKTAPGELWTDLRLHSAEVQVPPKADKPCWTLSAFSREPGKAMLWKED